MSWRTFNDSQVLTESWTKITTHSHIQNSIDLLTEDIRKGQSELHTIEEGAVGRAGTWLKNRVKGYGNMAKNIGKNIGIELQEEWAEEVEKLIDIMEELNKRKK